MSEFEKNSAWDQPKSAREARQLVEQRLPLSPIVKTASVHIATLEEWIDELEILADNVDGYGATTSARGLDELARRIRSHLPG